MCSTGAGIDCLHYTVTYVECLDYTVTLDEEGWVTDTGAGLEQKTQFYTVLGSYSQTVKSMDYMP